MPFTLAHPAIVLPLRKSGLALSTTGLVIGSMVPDLEYFVQLKEVESIGHHWYGVFLFDLPVGILLSFLFHNLLRNSFIANLPDGYRQRFIHLQAFDWNAFALANKGRLALSVLLGVLSHLAWDAFTHHDGVVVTSVPALAVDIQIVEYQMPVYFLLQIICSLLGLAIVYLQVMQLPCRPEGQSIQKTDYRYWMSFILLFFTIASWRLILWPEYNSFGGVLIAIMGSIFYSWIPVSIFFNTNSSFKKIKS